MRIACLGIIFALAASAQQKGAAVQVTITGGSNAGAYTIEDPRACQIESAKGSKPRTLKAAVSDAAKVANKKLVGNALFEIPLGAAGPSSPLVDIDLIFGEPDNVAADYYVTTISTTEKKGSGTVSYQESGGALHMKFQAQTDKGVKFEGMLDCFEIRTK